jgi:hypothetical protein
MIEHVQTLPFVAKPNLDSSTRGHDERRLGGKLIYCFLCKDKKPKGGWSHPCPKTPPGRRHFWE